MSELTIAMSRSANQPWGFRLHGGVDFASALTVLKVSFCLVDLFPLFPPHCCLFEICTSPFNWLIVMLGQLMLSARKGWFFFFFWLFFLWILGRTWVKRFVWFGLVWFGLVWFGFFNRWFSRDSSAISDTSVSLKDCWLEMANLAYIIHGSWFGHFQIFFMATLLCVRHFDTVHRLLKIPPGRKARMGGGEGR